MSPPSPSPSPCPSVQIVRVIVPPWVDCYVASVACPRRPFSSLPLHFPSIPVVVVSKDEEGKDVFSF